MANNSLDLAVLPATNEPYQLIYQDDVLIVVNKPTKLLTVPGRHPENNDCLIHRVKQAFPSAEVVHRLDYDTSGLLILPLNKRALSHVSKQFQARSVQKYYIALVEGKPTEPFGVIDLAIAPDEQNRPRYKIDPQGKPSTTKYELLQYDADTNQSRIKLEPITGRSHQLRVHMLALGHAILGDPFYASEAIAATSPRLMLHAEYIRFEHPTSAQEVEFSAAAPF